MIRLKNEVFGRNDFYNTLKKINESDAMNAKDAYWFNRFFKELRERIVDYEEIKGKLLNKYGSANEDNPTMFTIPKDNIQQYSDEISSLNEQVVKIEMDRIVYPENIQLSPEQMSLTEDIFDFSALIE